MVTLLSAGVISGWIFRYVFSRFRFSSIEQKMKQLVESANVEAVNLKKEKLLEAQSEILKEKKEQEREIRNQRNEQQKIERMLFRKEEQLDSKIDQYDKKLSSVNKKIKQNEENSLKLKQELERIAKITYDEAREMILQDLESKLIKEKQEYINKVEQETYHLAEKKSKEILVSVMQRISSETTSEFTTVNVILPSEEMKGRIIGKDGRNVKAFESMTGVNLIIGDSPDTIGVSCFDPIRREVARRALERLVTDGRINPTRIEDVVKKVSDELEQFMYEQGSQVLYDLKVRMKPELIKLLGSMYFRTSYGQNMLYHSKEVALLGEMIAIELGADKEIVKRGALLHDIGKAISTNNGVSHVEIGVDIAKRLGEDTRVVNAIAAHHGEVPFNSIESVIVQISDTISASRPGVRREVLESYIKRLEQFENIAKEFDGVEKAFAIQAGRELRILVDHMKVDDQEARRIAREIANKIENEVKYPGSIKITMIRETRITEYAK